MDDPIQLPFSLLPALEDSFFTSSSISLDKGKCYGLIGPKGCGKQIAEMQSACNSHAFYWSSQSEEINLDSEVREFILSANSEAYKNKRQELENSMQQNTSVKEEIRKLKIEIMLLDPKGSLAEGRAGRILCGLGFPINKLWGSIKELPKHLKKKVSLARALFLEPSLLILDEPTDVLDINALIFLESYLQDWKTTLIVVSQDRCFLDIVCKEIIYIDKNKLFQYKGNYSSFEEIFLNRESSKAQVKIQNEDTQKNSNGTEFHGKREEGKKPCFTFSSEETISKQLGFMFFTDVTFGYKKKKPLFSEVNCQLNYNPAIAVLGASGVGKSAFHRLASGQLKPQKGKVETIPEKMKFGIFDEYAMNNLPKEQELTSYLMETCKIDDRDAVEQQLSGLGLKSSSFTSKTGDLSLPEKARVILAKFCLTPHDAIFMDEPTKYLDLEMINELQKAVYSFKGGVMMVTNNEYLISESECDLCVIENLEAELIMTMNLNDYKDKVLRELLEPVKIPLIYKRKTPLNIDLRPKLMSDSQVIDQYIKTKNADPDIRNIGMYYITYSENYDYISSFCPTFPGLSAAGRTMEDAERRIRILIEFWIEESIKLGIEVPSPP